MGKHLASLHERPDLIISSPATRAYHTALNIADILGYRAKDIAVDPAIYYSGEPGVLNALRKVDDKHRSVFIFGHEPTCSEVIYHLCGQMTRKFATCSVFKIELDLKHWTEIGQKQGKKVFFISPKEIKD
jgi:phosphohistidine phosphatase